MKKNILLAPYLLSNKNNEQFYSFSNNWIKYIKKLNFNINFYSENIDYDESDGLILPGTGDIFKISKINLEKSREKIEKKLIKHFIKKKKPILTICRGSLFMASINGSKITKIKKHVRKNHIVMCNDRLINTNSFHNYQIKNKPKNFEILGISKDKNLEIIHNKSTKILGLMFHPERKNKSQIFIDNMLISFLNGNSNFSSWQKF